MLAVGCAARVSTINNLNNRVGSVEHPLVALLAVPLPPNVAWLFLIIGFVYFLRFLEPKLLFPQNPYQLRLLRLMGKA